MDSRWFYDNMYKRNYYLLYYTETDSIQKFLKKEWNINYDKPFLIEGCCLDVVDNNDEPRGIVIGLREFKFNPKWIAILTHECLHAVEFTFSHCGITWGDGKTNEAHCYYLEYLVKRFLNLIKNKK